MGLAAQKRKVGFLERLANVGRGRKEEDAEMPSKLEPEFGRRASADMPEMEMETPAPRAVPSRVCAALVGLLSLAALVLQYVLILQLTRDNVGVVLGTVRFFSYFTILSNIAVMLVACTAAAGRPGCEFLPPAAPSATPTPAAPRRGSPSRDASRTARPSGAPPAG